MLDGQFPKIWHTNDKGEDIVGWKLCPPGHWVPNETEPGTETLMVDSPPHYTVGGYEALDVIKAKLTPEEYRGYCKGNILKYVMRANYKGTHDTDCGKAEYYAKELKDATDAHTNED